MIKYTTFIDDDTSITKISSRQNNGDWDFWLVAKLEYIQEIDPDATSRYYISVAAVAPDALSDKEKHRALSCFGMNEMDVNGDLMLVNILHEYGHKAILWSAYGNNASVLWKQSRHETQLISMMFGFYMDRPQNALGATGWDWIAGNPLGPYARKETSND